MEQVTIGLCILTLVNTIMIMIMFEANEKVVKDVNDLRKIVSKSYESICSRLNDNEDSISELNRMQEGTSDVVVRMVESTSYSKREYNRLRSMFFEMYNDYSKYKSNITKIKKYMDERENDDEIIGS